MDPNKNHLTIFKTLLTCEYCKNIFDKPVTLPCGNIICEKDVNDLYKEDAPHVIICYFCSEEHDLSKNRNQLSVNKLIEKFLRSNIHNINLGKTYETAQSSLNSLKSIVNELEYIKMNPSNFLTEFFDEIEDRIKHKHKHVKTIIDEQLDNMIKDLTVYKSECQCSLELTNVKFALERVNQHDLDKIKGHVEKWYEELNKLKIDENEWKYISVHAQKTENELLTKLKEIKNMLFLNINCKFAEKHVDVNTNIFGELKLGFNDVENAKSHLIKKSVKKAKKREEEGDIMNEDQFAEALEEEILLKHKIQE